MKRLAPLFAVTMILAGAALAQAQLPPGKWWRRPDIVTTLALTEDQQNRLETVFRGAAPDLIDLKANVDKANVALRGELDQPQLNRQNIQHAAARLSEARAHLFERELTMLVDMRAVLTDVQWDRMRRQLDTMQQQQQQQRPRAQQMQRPRPATRDPVKSPGARRPSGKHNRVRAQERECEFRGRHAHRARRDTWGRRVDAASGHCR